MLAQCAAALGATDGGAPQCSAIASSDSHVISAQRVRSKLVRLRHLLAMTTPDWSPTFLQPESRSEVSDVFAAHTWSHPRPAKTVQGDKREAQLAILRHLRARPGPAGATGAWETDSSVIFTFQYRLRFVREVQPRAMLSNPSSV